MKKIINTDQFPFYTRCYNEEKLKSVEKERTDALEVEKEENEEIDEAKKGQ